MSSTHCTHGWQRTASGTVWEGAVPAAAWFCKSCNCVGLAAHLLEGLGGGTAAAWQNDREGVLWKGMVYLSNCRLNRPLVGLAE